MSHDPVGSPILNRSPTPPDDTASRPAWAAVWALALTVAMLNTSEMLPGSLLTPMAASLGASEGLIGQSVTATAVLAIFTSLFVARITRRVDRRTVLLVVAAAQVASNLIVAAAPNTAAMLGGRVLLGLTVGGVWGLSASLALRLVPTQSVSRALSIIFGGGSVAMVAASPIGAFLGGVIGWHGVFYAAAGLSAVAVLALAMTLPPLPLQDGTSAAGLLPTLRLPGLLAGMGGVLLLFAGQHNFITYMRPFLESISGFDTNGVAFVLLVFGAANFVGTMIAPYFLGHSLRFTLAGIAALEVVFLALLWNFGTAQPVAVALVGLCGFALGGFGVGWSTWIAEKYPDHAEATGGILVATIQAGMMLGAMVGGGLINAVGAKGPILASIVVFAIGAVHTVFALRSRP